MKIEQLDKHRILISLGENELADYALTFDSLHPSNPHAGHFLREMMNRASTATGISLHNKQIIIEAMQYERGCFLLLTVAEKQRRRKTYRVRRPHRDAVYWFQDVDALLRCIEALYRLHEQHPHSSICRLNDTYYLVLPAAMPLTRRSRCIGNEFAGGCFVSRVFRSYLQEHGQMLQADNAVGVIGQALTRRT